jgi:hypothetical protein
MIHNTILNIQVRYSANTFIEYSSPHPIHNLEVRIKGFHQLPKWKIIFYRNEKYTLTFLHLHEIKLLNPDRRWKKMLPTEVSGILTGLSVDYLLWYKLHPPIAIWLALIAKAVSTTAQELGWDQASKKNMQLCDSRSAYNTSFISFPPLP